MQHFLLTPHKSWSRCSCLFIFASMWHCPRRRRHWNLRSAPLQSLSSGSPYDFPVQSKVIYGGEPRTQNPVKKLSGSVSGRRRRRWRLERFSCGQLSVGSSRTVHPVTKSSSLSSSSPFYFFFYLVALVARGLCGIVYDLADVLQLHLGQRIPQAMQPALSADRLWDGSKK